MSHTGFSCRVKSKDRQNMECAILPPSRNVTTIPLDDTLRAILFFL